ncbi:hypothetical protein L596_027844 [Steinernema carpocapsae]|uniref:Uncharacterized protein n=1 Tax=Steinernema carpocapsae TaxID=34508 RepID=A0A4U5LWR8_STECR|nr:hypothetical protein L596_027844 [Steinernema carpocapsae]
MGFIFISEFFSDWNTVCQPQTSCVKKCRTISHVRSAIFWLFFLGQENKDLVNSNGLRHLKPKWSLRTTYPKMATIMQDFSDKTESNENSSYNFVDLLIAVQANPRTG